VILKKQRNGALSATEGKEILGLVAQMPIRYVEHESVLEAALSLAADWSLSFYLNCEKSVDLADISRGIHRTSTRHALNAYSR
jgi:hypothetical protein